MELTKQEVWDALKAPWEDDVYVASIDMHIQTSPDDHPFFPDRKIDIMYFGQVIYLIHTMHTGIVQVAESIHGFMKLSKITTNDPYVKLVAYYYEDGREKMMELK